MRDHAVMRALILAATVVSLTACSTEPAAHKPAAAKTAANQAEPSQNTEPPASPSETNTPAEVPAGAVEAMDAIAEAAASDTGAAVEAEAELAPEAGAGETGAPSDALEPELPEGPEPGSPEADAELLALLDESTLTQEEFERGFGKDGPKIDGDAFEFGPNSRTRGQPEVRAGRIEGPAAKALEGLVESQQNKLVSCLGMALTKDASATGSVTLRVELDGQGGVSEVAPGESSLGGASEIREALLGCLISVVEDWQLPDTKAGSTDLPLSLSTKT